MIGAFLAVWIASLIFPSAMFPGICSAFCKELTIWLREPLISLIGGTLNLLQKALSFVKNSERHGRLSCAFPTSELSRSRPWCMASEGPVRATTNITLFPVICSSFSSSGGGCVGCGFACYRGAAGSPWTGLTGS
jgi:hypothetical protein